MNGFTRGIAAALVGAAFAFGSAAQAAETEIKVAAWIPEGGVAVSTILKPWMAAVEADVGEKVELKGYWGGSLGRSPTKQYELLRNGIADVSFIQPGYTAGQFPEMEIFELPFLFREGTEAALVAWRLYQKGLLHGFEDVHVIGFFMSSPNIIFSREAVSSLADLNNRKLRSTGSLQAAWVESVGAVPQTLSAVEANEALNRKTISGMIQGWTGMNSFKSFPLVDYAYEVPTGVLPFMILMNKKTWEGLPDDVQASIMKHGGEAMARAGSGSYESATEEIRNRIKEEGRIKIVPVTNAEIDRYETDAKPIYDSWIAKSSANKAAYEAALEELKAIRSGSAS